MKRFALGLSLLLVSGVVGAVEATSTAPGTPAPGATLSFGVVPQQTATRLAQVWILLLDELGRRSGYRLEFKTAPNIVVFEERVAAGEYDLAYMNPYHYTVFHRAPGYRAFAREDGRLQGLIVVRRDSALRELAELHGQTVVFPAPAAFASTVLPLAQMRAQGISVTPKYVVSHDSVYLAVAKGLYPAGGGIQRTFEQLAPDVRDALRVIWTTAPATPHAFATHPRISRAVVDRLRRAMVELRNDPAGRDALRALGFTGFVAANDGDWNDVRALRIELLQPLLQDGKP